MKTMVFALIVLGFCAQARCSSISTTDGMTYNNVTAQRVDPDGLYIEYSLPGGGVGMSKVKFSRLSPDLQKQFGYDAAKARDYEAKVAKATEDFRQESIRDEQIASAARQARAEREEKAIVYHMPPPGQANAEESSPPMAPAYYGESYGGYGGYNDGIYAVPNIGRAPAARRDYLSPVRPIPFPQLNTPPQPRFPHAPGTAHLTVTRH
jgi:hypothetical protein